MMKTLLFCILVAMVAGAGYPLVKGDTSQCNGNQGIDLEKAIRALVNPSAPAVTVKQYQMPKYDHRQLDRLFETADR
jgi:hypothetical protein